MSKTSLKRVYQKATGLCELVNRLPQIVLFLPYESTIVNSDKAGQGSDQDAAIMIAGNAENDHVSCDSTVKGSMTTLTVGSTHQTSLDLFTVAAPGGGNKPKVKAVANHDGIDGDRIDELAKSVDKILKIVSSTKPDSDDVTLPIATLVLGGDATNLQDFISANRDFTLMEKDGLKYLTCNICAAYLSTPSCAREKSQGKRLPTSSTKGSLCHGLYSEDVDYINYTSGKNKEWY